MRKFSTIISAAVMALLLIMSCGTESTVSEKKPGGFTELDVNSRLAKESWDFLENYLEDKASHVKDLVLVSAKSQVVDGKNLILIASYRSGTQELYLRAEMFQNQKGDFRVNKVVYTYNYDLRKGD